MLLVKVLFIKKYVTWFFKSSKKKERTLPHEFIFVFIRYFVGAILLKSVAKSRRFRKKIKRGDGHTGKELIFRRRGSNLHFMMP